MDVIKKRLILASFIFIMFAFAMYYPIADRDNILDKLFADYSRIDTFLQKAVIVLSNEENDPSNPNGICVDRYYNGEVRDNLRYVSKESTNIRFPFTAYKKTSYPYGVDICWEEKKWPSQEIFPISLLINVIVFVSLGAIAKKLLAKYRIKK